MPLYAIRLPDGRLITDPDWHCPADVMRGAHGHGVDRMPGVLVRLDGAPKRIQRRRKVGWRMPKGAVYVGRPTKWGNPYRVEADAPQIVTHPSGSWWTVSSGAASYVVGEFRADLLTGRLEQITVADVRRELAGRDLACWCPLSSPCHGDVLLDLANGGAS